MNEKDRIARINGMLDLKNFKVHKKGNKINIYLSLIIVLIVIILILLFV